MASCQQKEDKNMTSMTKKFLTIMCTAMVAILAFTACSNDDEPKAVSSEEILLNINKVIVEQAKAEKLYQRGEDGSTLVIIAESKEAAHTLCERLILDRWDGKQRTIKFSYNKGVITLAPGTNESVFYNVTLKALDNFGDLFIRIAPEAYLEGENFPWERFPVSGWVCSDCGLETFKLYRPKKCNRCGGENFK